MDIVNSSWMEVFGFVLLHSTWVSIIVVIAVAVMLRKEVNSGSNVKASIVLRGVVSLILATIFLFIYGTMSQINLAEFQSEVVSNTFQIDASMLAIPMDTSAHVTSLKKILVSAWLIGLLLFILKYGSSFIFSVVLRHTSIQPVNNRLDELLDIAIRKMEYTGRKVKISLTDMVDSPIVIGIFKPAILIPIGLVNQLTDREVEAILLHEIGHLIRKDNFINIALVLLEILFYFNPLIWWLTSQMKRYREEACDDLVISQLNDRKLYVKTLYKVKSYSVTKYPELALGVKGSSQNQLLNRIKRILEMEVKPNSFKSNLFTIFVFIIIGVGITNLSATHYLNGNEPTFSLIDIFTEEDSDGKIHPITSVSPEEKATTRQLPKLDTLPSKKVNKFPSTSTAKIIKIDDEEEVEIKIKDGEVTKLIIDGREATEEEREEYLESKQHVIPSLEGELLILQDKIAELHESEFFQHPESFTFEFPELHSGEHFDHWMYMDTFRTGINFDSILAQAYKASSDAFKQLEEIEWPENMHFEQHPNGFSFDFNDKRFNQKVDPEWMERFKGVQDEFRAFIQPHDAFVFEFPEGIERSEELNWFDSSPKNLESIIGDQLNKDGFLIPNKENKVVLSGKYLKINGEKQPSNIWNKYKRLFEEETGVPLHKKSKLEFSIIGENTKKRYKAF